jgi:hypothetical protein
MLKEGQRNFARFVCAEAQEVHHCQIVGAECVALGCSSFKVFIRFTIAELV